MSLERLERVMWRLRRMKQSSQFTNAELAKAIMYECGTDDRTIYMNRKALKRIGWIRSHGRKSIRLTDADITGDDV